MFFIAHLIEWFMTYWDWLFDSEIIKSQTNSVSNDYMYELGCKLVGNNLITRHAQTTCHALDQFEKETAISLYGIRLKPHQFSHCYGCGRPTRRFHPVYIYSCVNCGNQFQKNRHLTRNLSGYVAIVTGGRTKLGHQITLKLLRAGAEVIPTTRNPEAIYEMFQKYTDSSEWLHRLHLYKSLDFDVPNLETEFKEFAKWINNKFGYLNVIINSAAQTIRCREKSQVTEVKSPVTEVKSQVTEVKSPVTEVDSLQNRYGDSLHVKSSDVNSWEMTILETPQYEMEEVMRINAIAPFLLIKAMHHLIDKSKFQPYIINVHAKEGLFDVAKSPYHIHTNMAKTALHMLTLCLAQNRWRTKNGFRISINGCDPGWISVDEYYEHDKPFIVPPLDEIDGAARILYPIFQEQVSSSGKTRRHFKELKF